MNTRLSVERSKVEESWKNNIEEIVKQKAEIESKYQELYKSTLSDKEKQELERQAEIERIQKLEQEKDNNYNLYKSHKTETDIFNSLSKYELFNPSQVKNLIKSEYNIDIKDNSTVIKTDEGYKNIDEVINEYLSKPENQNLIKSNARSGFGSNPSLSSPKNIGAKYSKVDVSDPNKAKEINALLSSGVSPLEIFRD